MHLYRKKTHYLKVLCDCYRDVCLLVIFCAMFYNCKNCIKKIENILNFWTFVIQAVLLLHTVILIIILGKWR